METRKHTAATLIVIAAIALASLLAAPAVAAEGKHVAHQPTGAGVVQGVVFNDWDQDGERDVEEPTLPDAEIILFALNGDGIATVITDLDGAFRFDGVRAGGYVLTENDPLGYSTLGENEMTVIVRDGETAEANFADVLLLTTIEPETQRTAIEIEVAVR